MLFVELVGRKIVLIQDKGKRYYVDMEVNENGNLVITVENSSSTNVLDIVVPANLNPKEILAG